SFFLSVFFRVDPWLLFLHRLSKNAVRLPRPVAIPGGQSASGLGAEPTAPTGLEGKSLGELGRGPQPTAVPDHADPSHSKPRPFDHDLQRDGTEMRQVPRQVQSVPSRTKPAKGQAIDVGHRHIQFSPGNQKVMS